MKIRIALLLALLISLIGTGAAFAEETASGVTYTSGFQIQNLTANTATVLLDFYRQDGTVAASKTYTIDPNASKNFYPITDVSAGFNGSLVISSDQDIRAINNLQGSGPANYLESTNGFQAGATTVGVPLIMCNNGGFNTWFNIQNTGAADAHVTINYIPGSSGAAGSEGPFTIKPGAAATFDQTAGSTTKNCSTLAGANGKFVGSAVITSDQAVAAVVMQLNTTTFKALLGYGGFAAGSGTVALPLIQAGNGGFYTSYQIQNVSTSGSATVSVTYGPNVASGGTFAPAAESFTVPAGGSKTILQSGTAAQNGGANDWTGKKYVGSATITATGGNVVAIVNQQRPGTAAMGSTYSGVDPSTATAKISAPLIMAGNANYYTSIQVQNVSAAPVTVNIKYAANIASGGNITPADENFTVAAGSSKTILQSGTPAQNGGSNDWTAKKYVGSATITATGGNVVAIVNQQNFVTAGDQLATNNAFNY